MKVVFGDTGGQLHDDLFFTDPFLFLDPAGQVTQFPMQCPAATAATGEINRAIGFILWVIGKTTGALMECFFAIVSGASFINDMALYDNDVILAF